MKVKKQIELRNVNNFEAQNRKVKKISSLNLIKQAAL